MPNRKPPFHSRQFLILTVFLGVWALVVVGRIFQLQVFQYRFFAEQARRQQERTVEVTPARGVIYDRNHHPLAMSVEVESIYADPSEMGDPKPPARLLSTVLDMDRAELERKLSATNSFAWIKRKVTAKEADRVRQMNLKGVYFQKENKRFYPKRELAAHVLGYVGMDGEGLAGVEMKYDDLIRGVPGKLLIERDARSRRYSSKGNEPQPGHDVVLTIDESIQFIAERELDTVMDLSRAKSGTVIVQDPHTGEILAMANRPTFNPNRYTESNAESHRNTAIAGIYEPGSTFKIVTVAGAIEAGLTEPEEKIDCQMGSINVAGHTIHDHMRFGVLTVSETFQKSSDVCSIKLALRMGNDKFYQYIRAFGFGEPTGIELPGEARGLTRPPERWWKASIGAIAMGQEIGVTPLQIITAASTVANQGMRVRPSILMDDPANHEVQLRLASLSNAGKQPQSDAAASGMHRVISPATAIKMQEMMAETVRQGTGKSAAPKGYSAGGKTGTAQKLDPATKTYSRNEYIASFAGFTPIDDPMFTILVVLDSPKGRYHGGDIAAPVFGRIAEQILAYRNLPGTAVASPLNRKAEQLHRQNIARSEVEQFNEVAPAGPLHPAGAVQNVEYEVPEPGSAAEPSMITPNFLGSTVRAVTAQAVTRNLKVQLIGSGVAFEQFPPPGATIPEDTVITVKFRIGSQTAPPPATAATQAANLTSAVPAKGKGTVAGH